MNVILVVAQHGFQDKEFSDTKEALRSKGFKCDVAAKTLNKASGKSGLEIMPDLTIEDALESLDMYAGVVFIGGPGATAYFDDKSALELSKLTFEKGKIIAAICIAPMILAKAGILKYKYATVWDSDNKQSAYFKQHSIKYTGEDVTVDENIVTGNGPDAAKKFGEKIAEILEKLE